VSAVLSGAACKEKGNTTSPLELHVPGSYRATTFITTTALGVENILRTGGAVTADFDPSGDVRGHVTIPRQTVNVDFAGKWRLNNGAVVFDQLPPNILIDALAFKVAGNALLADSTLSGTHVHVVLVKE
jgi:hypothetical protein